MNDQPDGSPKCKLTPQTSEDEQDKVDIVEPVDSDEESSPTEPINF